MAILKMNDIKKLGPQERKQKLAEIKLELTKSGNKGSQLRGKRKELKRAVARLHTFNNSEQGGLNKH